MDSGHSIFWIKSILSKNQINLLEPPETIQSNLDRSVQKIKTDRGFYFFKAAGRPAEHEPAVTHWLAHHFPSQSVSVLASEPKKGWFLMADGGQTLRKSFSEQLDLNIWRDVLSHHGRLQLTVSAHINDLLAFGTPDHRLIHLPRLFSALVANSDWLLIDQEDGLTKAEYQQLVEAIPMVKTMCSELASFGIPESIHHNDLHDGNIFYHSTRDNDRFCYFDWGDCAIAHPFFVCRTAFVSIEGRFGFDEHDSIFEELGIRYAETWRRYGSAGNLRKAMRLARKLWSLSTALKYKALLSHSAKLREEKKSVLPAIMQEFLIEQNR